MSTPATASALYPGRVMHRRLRPFVHGFRYRVFSLYLDLDELPGLDRRLRLFSHNRWNLFGFRDRDHGPRDGGPLRPWIERHLAAAGIDLEGGPVRLLCFPRVLGYVFDPLSVWFCFHADGGLRAILYEVSNTFGQRHGYLLPVDGPAPGEPLEQATAKRFYVSPFFAVDGRYDFRLAVPGDRLAVGIRLGDSAGPALVARQTGRRRPLSDAALARLFVTHPLMTLKVIGAIHWQALRLWLKGARPTPRPAPPVAEVSIPPAAATAPRLAAE
ncbi:MAG: DUF1365 domain-containing protein [Alphaproteobacteria bacterium]